MAERGGERCLIPGTGGTPATERGEGAERENSEGDRGGPAGRRKYDDAEALPDRSRLWIGQDDVDGPNGGKGDRGLFRQEGQSEKSKMDRPPEPSVPRTEAGQGQPGRQRENGEERVVPAGHPGDDGDEGRVHREGQRRHDGQDTPEFEPVKEEQKEQACHRVERHVGQVVGQRPRAAPLGIERVCERDQRAVVRVLCVDRVHVRTHKDPRQIQCARQKGLVVDDEVLVVEADESETDRAAVDCERPQNDDDRPNPPYGGSRDRSAGQGEGIADGGLRWLKGPHSPTALISCRTNTAGPARLRPFEAHMPDESDTRATEEETLAIPGVLCVSPAPSGAKRVRTGAAAGWMVPKGIMGWERELSFVLRADASAEIASALRATLPHEQIAPKKYAMAARAVRASPVLAVSSSLAPDARALGVRVHTVGVDRVSAGFFYFAEGGPGEPVRVQGNLVEMLAPALKPSTTNAEIEALLEGFIDRLLRSFSGGQITELDVELADALPRLSRDGTGLAGTHLDSFDATARSLALQSAPWEAGARELVDRLAAASNDSLDVASVPLFGEAHREARAALEVRVGDKSLHLPQESVWVVMGTPREDVVAETAPAPVPAVAAPAPAVVAPAPVVVAPAPVVVAPAPVVVAPAPVVVAPAPVVTAPRTAAVAAPAVAVAAPALTTESEAAPIAPAPVVLIASTAPPVAAAMPAPDPVVAAPEAAPAVSAPEAAVAFTELEPAPAVTVAPVEAASEPALPATAPKPAPSKKDDAAAKRSAPLPAAIFITVAALAYFILHHMHWIH